MEEKIKKIDHYLEEIPKTVKEIKRLAKILNIPV